REIRQPRRRSIKQHGQIGLDIGRPRHRGVIAIEADYAPITYEAPKRLIFGIEIFLQELGRRALSPILAEYPGAFVNAFPGREDNGDATIERLVADREGPTIRASRRDLRQIGELKDQREQVHQEALRCGRTFVGGLEARIKRLREHKFCLYDLAQLLAWIE